MPTELTTTTAAMENPKIRNLLLQAEGAAAAAVPGTGMAEAATATVGRIRRKTNVIDTGPLFDDEEGDSVTGTATHAALNARQQSRVA